MTTTKTLMLAALATLSLGVGNAMAQDGGGGSFPDYQSTRVMNAARQAPVTAHQATSSSGVVQSGSPDVDATEPGTAQFIFTHHLYGAGGVGG